VEEASFLVTVQRVVGRIEVEGDLLGRLAMGVQKQLDEEPLDRRRIMVDLVIAARLRTAQFEPVEGRLAGHRRAIRAPRCKLAGQNSQDRIMAKLIVIVEVLVAQSQTENALPDERAHAMLDQVGTTPVREARRKPIDQPDGPIGRSKQQAARIRSDRATVETGHDGPARNRFKPDRNCATLCRHRGDPSILLKSFSQNNFLRFDAPMHLLSVRYPG